MTALSIIRADSAHWEHIEREANEHNATVDRINLAAILGDCGKLFIDCDTITAPDGTFLDEIEHYAARVCDIVRALDAYTDCGGDAIMHYRNGGEYADF